MFQRKHTKINGVELPEEFSGCSIINNVAISNDGKKYAAVTRGGLVTGDVPSDGRIEIDGNVIQYKSGSPERTENLGDFFNGLHRKYLGGGSFFTSGSVSGGSIVMSGSGMNIQMGGNHLDYEIDEMYDLKEGEEVTLSTKNEAINLGIRNDNKVRVAGLISSKPEYSKGRLSIDDFDGKLELPRAISKLELALETKNGSVNGEIIHPGYVETKNGSIVLALYAPLIVDASTKNGRVNVVGMESQGHGRYVPIGESPVGKLRASTKNGSVLINYIRGVSN